MSRSVGRAYESEQVMVVGKSYWPRVLCALAFALCYSAAAQAQLRIVTYNTAMANTNLDIYTARAGLDVVLEAIGDESVGGIAKPIDVLLLQEQQSMSLSGQSIVDLLNNIYGAGIYARSTINGNKSAPDNSGGAPGLVYNTQTVELIEEIQFGTVGTGEFQQPRSTLRYHLRPVGYDSSADFYAYNSHYKSDTGNINNNRRLAEAQSIRANSDALGDGIHAIYAGDYNIQTSSGDMYQHLLSSGNGQAFDPINTPGSWNGSSAFKSVHTQSPANSGVLGLTGGGVDDRFDFQLTTGEFLDNEGLSYISDSYHAFGNNGTHTCCNSDIDTGTGAAPAVLNALMTASDHLPVVADYQLPAMMMASLSSIPSNVILGSTIGIDLFVENFADVLTINGADELDYTVSLSGALMGDTTGLDMPLGGGNTHQLTLDTSTAGLQSGTVTVTSSSQGAANALLQFPVSFNVVEFLAADFNQDGNVDSLDLAEWQDDYGLNADSDADFDGDTDGADFLVWQRQFGQSTLPLVASATASVPEPASILLCGFSGMLALVAQRPVRGSVS
jgi:hypothetical protein